MILVRYINESELVLVDEVWVRTEVILNEGEGNRMSSDPLLEIVSGMSVVIRVVMDMIIITVISHHKAILPLSIVNYKRIIIIPIRNTSSHSFSLHLLQ
jgi:hypothetical protein